MIMGVVMEENKRLKAIVEGLSGDKGNIVNSVVMLMVVFRETV